MWSVETRFFPGSAPLSTVTCWHLRSGNGSNTFLPPQLPENRMILRLGVCGLCTCELPCSCHALILLLLTHQPNHRIPRKTGNTLGPFLGDQQRGERVRQKPWGAIPVPLPRGDQGPVKSCPLGNLKSANQPLAPLGVEKGPG
jgi:hypothetical protein